MSRRTPVVDFFGKEYMITDFGVRVFRAGEKNKMYHKNSVIVKTINGEDPIVQDSFVPTKNRFNYPLVFKLDKSDEEKQTVVLDINQSSCKVNHPKGQTNHGKVKVKKPGEVTFENDGRFKAEIKFLNPSEENKVKKETYKEPDKEYKKTEKQTENSLKQKIQSFF